MNKVMSNIKYKTRYQFPWIAGYIGIYAVVMFLLYFILIKTDLVNSSTGSLSYRLWGSVFVLFALSMRFKEDFDFFLTLSNTRRQIMQSLAGYALAFSGLVSILILLERVLIDFVNNALGLNRVKDLFHYFAPYYTDNLLLQFIFFFSLCICCSAFGLLMGSLFYRLGKKFTIAFWMAFSFIPAVFFPLSLWVFNGNKSISQAFAAMGESFKNFNLPTASMIMFLLTIVFGLAAWFNIRKLPQK